MKLLTWQWIHRQASLDAQIAICIKNSDGARHLLRRRAVAALGGDALGDDRAHVTRAEGAEAGVRGDGVGVLAASFGHAAHDGAEGVLCAWNELAVTGDCVDVILCLAVREATSCEEDDERGERGQL